MEPTWQQVELFKAVERPGCRVACRSGHGCFGKGTEMLMYDGTAKAVENIAVGEQVMGDDSTLRHVLELCRGTEPLYRYEYMDGSHHIFNESHILCLVATQSHGRQITGDKVYPTVREHLSWSVRKQRTHAIYRKPVDYPAKQLKIPPYILGVWLGDGDTGGPAFTNPDPEIISALRSFAQSQGLNLSPQGRTTQYRISGNGGRNSNNTFLKNLRHYGLLNNKHIPHDYLTSSREDRLDLLAGILDTDAALENDGRGYEIFQKSEKIAAGIVALAKSLGLHAGICKRTKGCLYNGTYREGEYYSIHISRNVEIIPMRVERKKPATIDNPQRNNLHFGIRKVEPLGEGEYYGFVLDGNSKFLGADYTVLHNTGKSRAYAVICDWLLKAYPQSNTLLTATNLEQVRSVVWKELDTVVSQVNEAMPWMAPYFVKETRRYYAMGHKDSWYVIPRTASKHKPEGLAGQHRQWYTVLVDEAAAVDDEIHGVLRGALTMKENRYVMVSQQTRNVGHFADAFTLLKDIYTCLEFNAEESPLVSKEWIREKLFEYGGHHSPEYQIKVLGRSPDNLTGFLIPRSWLEESRLRTIEHKQPWGWVIMADVAEGVHRDSSVWTLAKVSGYDTERQVEVVECQEYLDLNEKQFAREIHQRVMGMPNVTIGVDADGTGRATILELEEMGHIVERIHWGLPPHSAADKKRYKNQRAFSHVKVREAIFDGRMKIDSSKKTIEQGALLPYKIDDAGRYSMMPKDQMKTNGIKSPDRFDTHCFFFLADYIPASDDVLSDTEENEILAMAKRIIATGEAA